MSRYGPDGTFGGKRELFLKTLDTYRDARVSYQLRGLETNAGWADLEAYFEGLLELAQTSEGQAGCFMCNTATEVAPQDAEVEKKVSAHIRRFQRVFRNALESAKRAGELSRVDAEEYADVLVGITQGIFALSRSLKNLSIIQNLVRGAVKKLSYFF